MNALNVVSLWGQDEDTEAIVCGSVRLTRGQARRRLFQLGHALQRQGLAPGDGVGVFVGNRAESVLVVLAVHLIGCRVVMLPPEPGPGELAALIDQSGAHAVLVGPAYGTQAVEAAERCTSAPVLLSVGSVGPGSLFAGADVLDLADQCPAQRPGVAPAVGLGMWSPCSTPAARWDGRSRRCTGVCCTTRWQPARRRAASSSRRAGTGCWRRHC